MLKCSPEQRLNAGQQVIWKKKNISDVATVTGSYVYTATLSMLPANLASRLIQDFPLA